MNKETEFYNDGEQTLKVTIIEPKKEEQQFNDTGFIENNLIILTKYTIDRFLKEKNPGDLIALYSFYYYTAKWQKTNKPYCTTIYTNKGLQWSKAKVRKIKKQLIDLGLIENFIRKNKKTNKIEGHYIKMNYVFKQKTIEATLTKNDSVENHDTNALSPNILNALNINNNNCVNTNIEGVPSKKCIDLKKKDFSKKENIFPKKKEINPLTKKIIEIFLDENKEASKEKNYSDTNIKYTTLYINKYIKEYETENTFIESFKRSLYPYKNNNINLPKESSHHFNFPNKNAVIQSNYLYHRDKKNTLINKIKKDKYPVYTQKFCDVLLIEKNNDLISYVNRLVLKNEEIKNNQITLYNVIYTRDQIELIDNFDPDYNNVIRALDGFIQEYVYWLEEQLENETFRFEYKFFDNNFKMFSEWIFHRFDRLSFFPSTETMIEKVKNYMDKIDIPF